VWKANDLINISLTLMVESESRNGKSQQKYRCLTLDNGALGKPSREHSTVSIQRS
jgi:hypothetical protein